MNGSSDDSAPATDAFSGRQVGYPIEPCPVFPDFTFDDTAIDPPLLAYTVDDEPPPLLAIVVEDVDPVQQQRNETSP